MSPSQSRAGTRAVTWRYALVGGLLSIPLTGGFYWLSGMGNSLSLNMVFVGGLVAGYLANTRATHVETTAVGLRAGVIVGLPAFWILGRIITAAQALTGPLWFRTIAQAGAVLTMTGVILGVAAIVGALGAHLGAWLARTLGHSPSPTASFTRLIQSIHTNGYKPVSDFDPPWDRLCSRSYSRQYQSSQSGDTTHQLPSKQAALLGGIVGISVALISHLLLLDSLLVTITICILYCTGVTFLIDYMRILRQAPGNNGSWWTIGFGATTGLVLIVIQRIYRPIVSDEIAIRRDYNLPEEVVLVPSELLLVSWLLVFGVALVSLVCGIGMSVTDLSEY